MGFKRIFIGLFVAEEIAMLLSFRALLLAQERNQGRNGKRTMVNCNKGDK